MKKIVMRDGKSKTRYEMEILWENSQEKWHAKSGFWGTYYSCSVYDQLGNEVGKIRQNVLKSMVAPNYSIYLGKEKKTELRRRIAIEEAYQLKDLPYQIEEDPYEERWDLKQGQETLMCVQRMGSGSWGRSYQIQVEKDGIAELGICIALAKDMSSRLLSRAARD